MLLQKIQAEIAKPKITKISTRPSQKSLLSGLVRKRTAPVENESDSIIDNNDALLKKPKNLNSTEPINELPARNENGNTDNNESVTVFAGAVVPANVTLETGALQCIGILPGIGKYTESSDSDKSTDTEEDYDNSSYDWLGRKAATKSQCQEN